MTRSRDGRGRRSIRHADASQWPESIRAFWESGEAERFGVSGSSGERVDYMRRVDGPGDRRGVEIYTPRPWRRQHGTTVDAGPRHAAPRGCDRLTRPAARIHPDAARPARCGVAALTAAAGPDRAPRQPADAAAHRGAHRVCRWRLVAKARDRGEARRSAARRGDAGRRRVQPHGGSARGESRAARLPGARGQLAIAGAQDRARAEELADADPADGGGDAGAAHGPRGKRRARVHGPGRADRGQRDRIARTAGEGILRVRERAAGASRIARHQRGRLRARRPAAPGPSRRDV